MLVVTQGPDRRALIWYANHCSELEPQDHWFDLTVREETDTAPAVTLRVRFTSWSDLFDVKIDLRGIVSRESTAGSPWAARHFPGYREFAIIYDPDACNGTMLSLDVLRGQWPRE